jgi:hypothetical protein
MEEGGEGIQKLMSHNLAATLRQPELVDLLKVI